MRALAGSAAVGVWLATLSSLAVGVAGAQTLPVSPPKTDSPSLPAPPQVQVPQLPKLPGTPSSPNNPSPPGSGGGTPSLPGLNGGGGSGGGGSRPGSGGNGGAAGGSSSSGSTNGTGGGSSQPAESNSRSERRFQRSVRRLRGCFGTITSLERRVLSLRVGLSGHPQSRAATAKRLGTSSRHVSRTERNGLRRLRQAAGSGACTRTLSVGDAVADGALSAAIERSGKTLAGRAPPTRDRGQVLEVSESSADRGPGDPPLGSAELTADGGADVDESGPNPLLWLAALLALGAGAVELLRRRGAGGLAVEDSEIPPAPWARDDHRGR